MRWRSSSHTHPRPRTAGSNVQIRFSSILSLSLCPASFLAGYNHCHLSVPVVHSLPAPPYIWPLLLPPPLLVPPPPLTSSETTLLSNTLLNVFLQDQLSLQLHLSSLTQPHNHLSKYQNCCCKYQPAPGPQHLPPSHLPELHSATAH